MNIKATLKKYKYLTNTAVRSRIRLIQKKRRRLNYKYTPSDLSPLSYEKLPFPFPWNHVKEYKEIYAEIGSGHGEQLFHLAQRYPGNLYIGFEIFKKFALLTSKRIKSLDNALVFKADGYEATTSLFSNGALHGIFILFPDPWHKKRHHKRRPIVEKWFRDVEKKLINGGFIFFASDWEEYYDFVLNESHKVKDIFSVETGSYDPKDWDFAQTHYYKKWRKEGREFNYIKLEKLA